MGFVEDVVGGKGCLTASSSWHCCALLPLVALQSEAKHHGVPAPPQAAQSVLGLVGGDATVQPAGCSLGLPPAVPGENRRADAQRR